MRRARLKALAGAGGVLLGAVLLIGFAHTEAGRPLLNALRGAPGCPVDLTGGDVEAIETFRQRALAPARGQLLGRSTRALGFVLGQTSRADVERALSAERARCASLHAGSVIQCRGLSASVLGREDLPISDLHAQFDAHERLVAIDVFRDGRDAETAIAWLAERDAMLHRDIGRATHVSGPFDPAVLRDVLRPAALAYHYANVVAEISAMRFGKQGVRVREQYQWLPRDG